MPAVLAERATPPTTDRLTPVFMTRVGIAASPAFRAGFLISAEKGFMVLCPAKCDNSALVVGALSVRGLSLPVKCRWNLVTFDPYLGLE